MTAESADSTALDELSYREIQSKLKLLGLPAKGADKVLRERLAEALAEGQTLPEGTGPASSPPSSPSVPQSTRKRRSTQEAKSPKRERYVVTTEVKNDKDSKLQSQALLSATKAALPDANVRVKRAKADKATGALYTSSPVTPLERVKQLASDSASKLRKSASRIQQKVKKQKLSKWWPALGALLLVLLLSGGVGLYRSSRSSAWQKQISRQMESIQGSLESLYQTSQYQANRVGSNIYQGYGYVQDGLVSGSGRLSRGASQLWDTGSQYAGDTYDSALHYLPAFKKLRAALPTSACSARLKSTLLNSLLPASSEWDGLKISLQDAWSGLKDDPLKGTGVLLAGHSASSLEKAASLIEAAVPLDCKSCYLHLKGDELATGGNHAAGELQLLLYHHLHKCPNAIVHIQNLGQIHADLLTVLLAVLSEQGGLTVNGVTLPAYKALYIGSVIAPGPIFQLTDEQQFTAAVKRDLVTQFEIRGGPSQSFIAEVFRRRWDFTAPLQ